MATQIINTTFKLKRGTAERWMQLNPILRQGEPGFEFDTNKFKIGNGYTPYNELPYQTSSEYVISRPTSATFPLLGEENVIYKATEEHKLYQWNVETKKYEVLNHVDLTEIHSLISALQQADVNFDQKVLTLSEKIEQLTNGAPEGFRTLKEIYDYVSNIELDAGVINGILINNSLLDIIDGKVEIPFASMVQAGVVKGANSVNKIQVNDDGTMEVHSLGISKIIQDKEITVVLDGGNSIE